MEIKRGVAVSQGIAIGPAFVMESERARITRKFVMPEEQDHEVERFEKALKKAAIEIADLTTNLTNHLDESYNASDIFRMHMAILNDPKLCEQVTTLIRNRSFTPEYALSQVLRRYVKSLENAGNNYLLQRVGDFDDIEQRLLRNLMGEQREDLDHIQEPVIVIARDLTPTQTASFDQKPVLGMATDAGGRTSHTAILARALGIPAVVGIGTLSADISGGDMVIVDGTQGMVIVDPDELTLRRYQSRARDLEVLEEQTSAEFCNLPAVTRDGHQVTIEANIEFPTEVAGVLNNGGEGIGLYRTEFLYHTLESAPDEAAHFETYMEAIRTLGTHPMTIRLLDMGADKVPVGFKEHNPFLGCRSMRLMRVMPEMFRQQIRAILRASALGKLRFMFPMIATLEELKEAKDMVRDVMNELDQSGTQYDKDVKIGMMIEVPSAALLADMFATEVDFFSIGTNDLIQYTLAVDRNNEHVSHLYSPVDPSILRLIRKTVEAAEHAGIGVSLCGEMAGDIVYTMLLVGLGIRRLSMAPKVIADIKRLIRSMAFEDAQRVANTAMEMRSAHEIEAYLANETRQILPDMIPSPDPVQE